MHHSMLAFVFFALFAIGQVVSGFPSLSSQDMQLYAVALLIASAIPALSRGIHSPQRLLSCHTVVLLSPIWFLYLEAIIPNGDVWLLPPAGAIQALSYVAFFLFGFNMSYIFKMPKSLARMHDKFFLSEFPPSFLAFFAIVFTLLLLFVIWGYYQFDHNQAIQAYLGGRSTGSGGLIKRGGVGGWEVFLQPFSFMAPVVPTFAALSWVKFGNLPKPSLYLRLLATSCAVFLIFLLFLGGSRGNMAVYLVGPVAIWLLFGRRLPKLIFIISTFFSFLLLIGVWQYQMQTRSNLLTGIGSVEDIAARTSFNPVESHRDNNLYLFTLNVMHMPDPYPFQGYSEFGLMLVNPIPRALWPNKPKGIQQSEYTFRTPTGPTTMGPLRFGTASLSSSIVSDGFKMDHLVGISLYALIIGFLSSVWDSLGQKRLISSQLYFIINSAWIFWILWGFRSSFALVTGMYSVWGAYLLCYVVSKYTNLFGFRKRKLVL